MRYRAIIFLALLTLNCDRESEIFEVESLIGKWQWINSVGGIAGETRNPEVEGYTRSIEFDNDSNFFEYRDDTVYAKSKYSLVVDESILTSEMVELIEYDDYMFEGFQTMYELRNDSMFLTDNCIDCFYHSYVKIDVIL